MRWAAFGFCLALGACASIAPAPVNGPLPGAAAYERHEPEPGEDVLLLALSGGGARAASFQLGAMLALRDMKGADGRPLTQHIALMTAVSGGAVLSAYYGLHGQAGLDTFRAAYLDKDWRLASLYLPGTWWRMWRGGANGAGRLSEWLDREVYAGARLGAMNAGPRIVLNAADLSNATPFAFTELFFAPLCSDVREVRVADAVAASMAVPLVFRPVALQTFADQCEADLAWAQRASEARDTPEMVRAAARALLRYDDPAVQPYVYLVDGGVADNLGVTTIAIMRAALPAPAPLTPRQAVQARRVLFLVLNAERETANEWADNGQSPGGGDVLAGTLDVSVDAAKRSALDALRAGLGEMQADWISYRCALGAEQAAALGAGQGWRCDDLALTMEMVSLRDAGPDAPEDLLLTPTVVSLPEARVDALIAAGRHAVERNAAVRALTQ